MSPNCGPSDITSLNVVPAAAWPGRVIKTNFIQRVHRQTVQPVKPVSAYFGGKSLLAKTIIKRSNKIPHDNYVEPFVGMGGIFLRRDRRPKCEIINDLSKDVYTLFLILREHYQYFLDMLRFRLTSREDFKRLVNQNPESLTDLQRAARFLYLQRCAYGGKIMHRSFSIGMEKLPKFNLTNLEPMLADVFERLTPVNIENLPYEECIGRYDRSNTLFYLDPPYWDCEKVYGKNVFSKEDFEKLAKILGTIKGRFLLSINDRPQIREIFKRFDLENINVHYSVNKGTRKQDRELIISN